MDLQLKNKLALVTGGSHGIGKAIALTLAREGADIIICGRDSEKLTRAKKEIISSDVRVWAWEVDATNRMSIEVMFSYMTEFNSLDILVNNIGGVEQFGGFTDLTDEAWNNSMNLNFTSMRHFCEYAIPWLKKSLFGKIVNVCTVPAHQPGFFNPHYAAAKAAMLNLSKYLANSLGKDGILVNTVCPSTIQGGAWKSNVQDRANRQKITIEQAEQLIFDETKKKNPLGKVGQLDDVADIVAFLCSPRNQFITGNCINVDGGSTRTIS